VLLEDGNGKWEVLLDDPVDKFLMGVFFLAIVGECAFHTLALSLEFSHLDGLAVNIVMSKKGLFVD
jgi:hypothetical protein